MRSAECKGIDKSKKDRRIWIIQRDDGMFQNVKRGFGGDDIREFVDYKDAINAAKCLSELYKRNYYVFELTDQVIHESIITVENLRQ